MSIITFYHWFDIISVCSIINSNFEFPYKFILTISSNTKTIPYSFPCWLELWNYLYNIKKTNGDLTFVKLTAVLPERMPTQTTGSPHFMYHLMSSDKKPQITLNSSYFMFESYTSNKFSQGFPNWHKLLRDSYHFAFGRLSVAKVIP